MEEDDNRFEPMCCDYLSSSPCNDILLGAEECTSPFGTYELSMPIDDTITCALNGSLITHKSCREFDVSFMFWFKNLTFGNRMSGSTLWNLSMVSLRLFLSSIFWHVGHSTFCKNRKAYEEAYELSFWVSRWHSSYSFKDWYANNFNMFDEYELNSN